jgi:hypothetical protein
MTGASKNTVVKLLIDIGCACAEYQYTALRILTCRRLQLDEIWSFRWLQEQKRRDFPERWDRRRVDRDGNRR